MIAIRIFVVKFLAAYCCFWGVEQGSLIFGFLTINNSSMVYLRGKSFRVWCSRYNLVGAHQVIKAKEFFIRRQKTSEFWVWNCFKNYVFFIFKLQIVWTKRIPHFNDLESNFALRNFLVIAKLFTNANLLSKLANLSWKIVHYCQFVPYLTVP